MQLEWWKEVKIDRYCIYTYVPIPNVDGLVWDVMAIVYGVLKGGAPLLTKLQSLDWNA